MHKKYERELRKFILRKIPNIIIESIKRHNRHSKIIASVDNQKVIVHASCTPSDYRTMDNIVAQIKSQIRK